MKTLCTVAAALFLASSIALRPAQAPQEHAADETALEQRMHTIEDELKALRRLVRDPAKFPAALESLAKLQAAAVAAKSETPRQAAQVPEAERAKFTLEYRREMVACLELTLKLERALLDGDAEQARAAFEALHDMEDPAHERFAPEAEEHEGKR